MVLAGLQGQHDASRLSLALQQYALALRYWYFGGEWLSLAHLYMAAETLTDAVLSRACPSEGREALATWLGIDIADKQKWRHELQVWARKEVIFEGDNATYRDARHASDGIEHGLLEFNEINRHAMATTAATFGYIRKTILRLLDVDEADHPGLYSVIPRDVGSLRKLVRGHFLGNGSDPAPTGEDYPRLEWRSEIRTMERDGDRFNLSFLEHFTVQCSPAYVFQGKALEARGRLEPGDDPIRLEEIEEFSVRASGGPAPVDELSALLSRVNQLAAAASAASTTTGIPTPAKSVFDLLAEQVALQEAIQVLTRDRRPVEAMILTHSLLLGACRLEAIANHTDPQGAAVRLTIDSLERQATLFATQPGIVERVRQQIADWQTMAKAKGIRVPAALPDPQATAFFADNADALRFTAELAAAGDFAAQLHTVNNSDGSPSVHTQITNAALMVGTAVDTVTALLASIVAATQVLGWPVDTDLVTQIAAEAERLLEAHSESRAANSGPHQDQHSPANSGEQRQGEQPQSGLRDQ